MADFVMCEQCRREYDDPADRRFHAQPNACAVCGPQLEFVAPGNARRPPASAEAVLGAAADLLKAGGIIALKGLGGYQLACDARRESAVAELRAKKGRPEKTVRCDGRQPRLRPSNLRGDGRGNAPHCAAANVPLCCCSGGRTPIWRTLFRPINPNIGVMLPCTPMHDLLFRVLRRKGLPDAVLVMTSGNISEEPIVIDNGAAEAQLAGIADAFVHHNRAIHTRLDDSIVRVVEEQPLIFRRARGYAPQPVWLGRGEAAVLACGAQQKSTFCLTKAGFALPSQHLGDLENYETLQFYEQTLDRMRGLFHVQPNVIAHDLHPGYLSTQLAKKLPAERHIGVQHHHAHIASCMAEHQLTGKVIGVAWDGTGLGTDGTIWGGEFSGGGLHRL